MALTSAPLNCGDAIGDPIFEFGDCGNTDESNSLASWLKLLLFVGDPGTFMCETDLLLVKEAGEGCDAEAVDTTDALLGLLPVTELCKSS